MKKYDPDAHCPKCDWPGASTRYISGYKKLVWSDGRSSLSYFPEIMVRVCSRCSYKWNERPLGSEFE